MLIYSGLLHTINPYHFASATAAYQLLPVSFLYVVPFVLANLMIVLGVSFICEKCTQVARVTTFILLSIFAVAQTIGLVFDMQISFGCFGHGTDAISIKSISVPVSCAAVCAVNLIFRQKSSAQNVFKENLAGSMV